MTALNYKLLSYKFLSITEIILFMLVHDLDKNIFLFSGTKRVFLGKSTHLLYYNLRHFVNKAGTIFWLIEILSYDSELGLYFSDI